MMITPLLDSVGNTKDVKKLSFDKLALLCSEIRSFLIDSVSKTGGHIGANLGVVELTAALHYVLDLPNDKLIFDTGHQGYTHKLLTGRKRSFATLNRQDGMSRFLAREESPDDVIDASHAGTAVSIATGFALSNKLKNNRDHVVAVVGDGSLVEGMSGEAVNFAVADRLPLIIIVNDNGMAIPPNVGGIKNLFSGDDWQEKSRGYFTGLGYQYLPVPDGHNLSQLIDAYRRATALDERGAVIVHVKTEKGKGLPIAKDHKYKLHFSMPFDPATGAGSSPTPAGRSFAKVAAQKLRELMAADKKILAITPSTPYASDLDECFRDFPERTIDTGMAEQQALGLASGLALNGMKPFVCYQSTFMQRAFDQLFHEIGFMNLPVTILAVRSGFAGFDSHTHHGIYDISYLRCIPNLKIFYPGHSSDLEKIIELRAKNPEGPMVILYPYENVPANEDEYKPKNSDVSDFQEISSGTEGVILAVGNRLPAALELRRLLADNNQNFGVVNVRWLKPLPEANLRELLKNSPKVITLEENVSSAGFGSAIAELICDYRLPCQLARIAVPNKFIKPGLKDYLSRYAGIDAVSAFDKIKSLWPRKFPSPNKKCVLLLGGSVDQLFIIKTARDMGLKTAVLDANAEAPGLALADYSAPIDFSDIPKVIKFVEDLKAKGVNVCGVTTMGSDVPHIVSRIAREFGWVGPTEKTGRVATNKYEMKCCFRENNIPIPNFALVSSAAEIINYWREWGCCRVIIKPTDRAGSRGVRLIEKEADAEFAYAHALKNSKIVQVQLEEYLDGLQISTESVLTAERCETPGFADRVYEGMEKFWPQIMENGGFVPSVLDGETKNKVKELVARSARALGIISGVAKGDVVIHPQKGPMMIEMAARLSGGDFCESLVPLGAGINYVETALKIAVGEQPDFDKLRPSKKMAVANRYFFPPAGILEEIIGADEVRSVPEVEKLKFFYKIGETIPIIQNHGQRAGVVIVVGENREKTQKLVDDIYEKIKFKINGTYYTGKPGEYQVGPRL